MTQKKSCHTNVLTTSKAAALAALSFFFIHKANEVLADGLAIVSHDLKRKCDQTNS